MWGDVSTCTVLRDELGEGRAGRQGEEEEVEEGCMALTKRGNRIQPRTSNYISYWCSGYESIFVNV